MPRAAPCLALLLALVALLAPTALAATCVYCKGNTRLSCYTGFPIAPTCKWWGSETEVSLGHCGTLAHCDDVLTRGGVTYDLKAVLDYNGACPNSDSPVECGYDDVKYFNNRRRALLGSRRAMHSTDAPAAQGAPVVTAADAQPASAVQTKRDAEEPAVYSLSMAERLELVDLSEHTELLSSAAGTDGTAPRLDVDAAVAAGYSQRAATFLAGWYEEQANSPAPVHAPGSGAPAAIAPRSLPGVAVKTVLKTVAKNWPKIVGAVEKVIGRAAAAKYFNLAKFQGALETALAASDALDAALYTAIAYILPSWMSWAVGPIAWALRLFISPV